MLRNLKLETYRRLRRIRAEQPVAGQSARRQERLREDLDPGGDPLSGVAGRSDGSCRVRGSARRTHRCRATQRGFAVGRGWIQHRGESVRACVGGRPSERCRPAGVNGDGLAAGRDPQPARQHGAGRPAGPARPGHATALGVLSVADARAYPSLSPDEEDLRRRLRAHGRQLGAPLDAETGVQLERLEGRRSRDDAETLRRGVHWASVQSTRRSAS